ncbi:hypothetical protein [Nostoc sp. CHAB 5715]|uniref:hypothetical protein n=1 Tax=Nostoc sp. CHAB 5715 TaxID=2780400 RepID=UPI001E56C850|nr:hypothetical protein [Nostoc sp. CHAB 5715]MCC5622619.1 hypothetical protein [Nostoc sp. CHAB 5715]
MTFPKTLSADLSSVKPTIPPEFEDVGFLAPNVGTFIITTSNGTANFLWQHHVRDVDFHSEKLAFKGIIPINGVDFYYSTISIEKKEDGSEQIDVIVLLSVQPGDVDEGHRIFYKRQGDTDFHLWAIDAKKFELHTPALGISS